MYVYHKTLLPSSYPSDQNTMLVSSAARLLSENVSDMLAKPSISAGLGLIYRFDPVRVEMNFGVPLVASKSDGTRKGIQVGVGLEFL